jgi:hypothetical protein
MKVSTYYRCQDILILQFEHVQQLVKTILL